MMHMTLPGERAAEALAITEFRAAARHGCPPAAWLSKIGTSSSIAVSLPAAFLTTAAQTVGNQPIASGQQTSGPVRHVAHTASGGHARRAGGRRATRGTALETAAITNGAHGSMLWTYLLLALVLLYGVVAFGRRWLSAGGQAGLVARVRPGRSTADPSPSSTVAWPELVKTFETKPLQDISAPPDGWAEPALAVNGAGSFGEISAPAGGWAPPPMTTNGNGHATANGNGHAAEIVAPPDGWAPPVVRANGAPSATPNGTPPAEDIPAPDDGWAPALFGAEALTEDAPPAPRGPAATGPAVTQRRELRAHRSAALRLAGGAIAAFLAARRSRR